MRYRNVTEAYLGTLRSIKESGQIAECSMEVTSVGSCFGKINRKTKECIGVSFVIENPLDRCLKLDNRNFNITYALAFSIWTLAGSDSLDFIGFYNPKGELFSDDGLTLHGSHGKRLLNSQEINQVQNAINLLKSHPHTRRAVLHIHQLKDLTADSRDIPCLLSIQLLIREDKLHMLSHMRSQSAYKVMPYDLFSLTFLHEALAIMLDKEIGNYHHIANSMHYYLDEKLIVNKLVKDNQISVLKHYLPRMPSNVCPFDMAKEIIQWDMNMRKTNIFKTPCHWPKFWKNIGVILMTHHIQSIEKKAIYINSLELESLYKYHLDKYLHEFKSI